jgi:CheY-like chemotaxis protein
VDPLHDEFTALHRACADAPPLREALARVEASLHQARLAADSARRTRMAFLANMGHELRTPLNAILGFSQLLRQDRKLAPEQLTHVEIIQRSGEQLLTLINDVLELSRQDVDESRNGTNFDLLQLIDDLEDMLYLRAERRGLRLRVVRDPRLPRHCRADGPKLRQLFLLLLGNAIKFARPGDLGLHLACEPDLHDPRHGLLRCRLTLPGLTRPDLEAFVRSTGSTGEASSGPSLAQELAGALGGEIEVHTDEIRIKLPVDLVAASEEPTPPHDPVIVGLAPDQPSYRILVAEDRWQSRQLLVQMLARVGFDVREASNGAEALEIWQQWRPQLIWMDMRMPGVTGLEATLRIKRSPGGKQTIVIALTASAFDEDPATARAAGCDDFVRKPIRMPEVFAKLREHLGVLYRYEHTAETAAPTAAATTALTGLPAPWLGALQRACVRADLDEILALITELRAQAPGTAAALDDLARRFNYDQILALTRAALGGPA